MAPEDTRKYLDGPGLRCGLNAHWSMQAWHFGPALLPNYVSGDYYILERPNSFELVRRFYPDDTVFGKRQHIETLTIAQGGAETMVATVQAVLKEREKRQ